MSEHAPDRARRSWQTVTVLSALVMLCSPRLGARLARWSWRMRTRIGLGLARIGRRVTACEDRLEHDDTMRGGG